LSVGDSHYIFFFFFGGGGVWFKERIDDTSCIMFLKYAGQWDGLVRGLDEVNVDSIINP